MENFFGMTRRGVAALIVLAFATTIPAMAAPKMKIGFIGAGNIGGTLAKFWADAGYQVMISARDLDAVTKEAAEIGPNASAGTPAQAAAFGQVVVISVPWSAFADIARENAAALKGKVVIDTCNPNARDGDAGKAAVEKGAGITDQALLPGAKLVRAFSSLNYLALRNDANRAGEKYGVPVGGDDKDAIAVVSQLVTDAGFEPVVVGDLGRSKMFDLGGPAAKPHPVGELRAIVGQN
jgi:8-hydroxy-5-deazaflavin:NADPH oxidoreductase